MEPNEAIRRLGQGNRRLEAQGRRAEDEAEQ
jgi:hypothetical protein